MSATTVTNAAKAILAAALPGATVVLGIPMQIVDSPLIYLYHDGSSDEEKAAHGVVRRTHTIPIHLLVLATADPAEAEADLMVLHDTICDAFYTNRTLSGAAATSVLLQREGQQGAAPAYLVNQNAQYRHRWWQLQATETRQYTFA